MVVFREPLFTNSSQRSTNKSTLPTFLKSFKGKDPSNFPTLERRLVFMKKYFRTSTIVCACGLWKTMPENVASTHTHTTATNCNNHSYVIHITLINFCHFIKVKDLTL